MLINSSVQNGNALAVISGQDKRVEASLVLAACSGDSHAFVELSQPHSKRVLCTLYRITKDWQDAEDALQEALMKAFLHLDSFQGKASFSTWFTRIAVNSGLMLLRKRRGLKFAIDADDGGTHKGWEFKDPRDNPEQSFERQQQAALVHSAVLQLRPELRKAVVLRYSGDLSIREIALCLGISEAAAKSRLLRGRTALRVFVQRAAQENANCDRTREECAVHQVFHT